jgi:hypothetical protein
MTTITRHDTYQIGDPEKFEAARVAHGMTPSAEAVAKAGKTVKVRDARGRVITLKKPAVLSQYRLIETLGEAAKNDVYVAMTLPLIYVIDIDDIPVTVPANRIQLDGLISRLDEDGVNAVMEGIQEHFGAQDPEADKAAIKK